MQPPLLLPLLIALLLVLLSTLLVAAERVLAQSGPQRRGGSGLPWASSLANRLRSNPERFRFACRLGLGVTTLGLGWIGIPAAARLLALPLAPWAETGVLRAITFAGAILLVIVLHLVIAECIGRTWARHRPEAVLLVAAPVLHLIALALFPVLRFAQALLHIPWRAVPPDPLLPSAPFRPASSEEAAPEGQSIALRHLMAHTLELDDLEIADLMRPWREAVTLQDDEGHAEVLRIIRRHRYSRYPLLSAEAGSVLGIVHVKDVLLECAGAEFPRRLRALARPPEQVRSDSSVLALSKRFRLGGSHFALVHDLDDQLSGFLTLEDIFETVFGEIADEYERGREQQVDRRVIRLRDGSLLVRGDTPLYRLERELGYTLPEAGASSTVGGLIMALLDRIPQEGDALPVGDRMLSVRRCVGPRVLLAKLSPPDGGV